MTDNHQQATTTSNHFLNSTITPEEKLFDGYDPKNVMSEQHSIGSKDHPHLVYLKRLTFLENFIKMMANLNHDIVMIMPNSVTSLELSVDDHKISVFFLIS